MKKLAGLQEQRAERARVAPLRVQHRQRRRGSRPSPAGAPISPNASRSAGTMSLAQHARVGGRGGVPLVALARREQRDAVRRQLGPRRSSPPAKRVSEDERVVLRAVVGQQQPQRRAGLDVGRAPHARPRPSRRARARGSRPRRSGPGRLGLQPRRRLVARQLEHRLLAERARRALRVAGVEDPLGAAVGVVDLELVLEPLARPQVELEHPRRRRGAERRVGQVQTLGRRTAVTYRWSGSATRNVSGTRLVSRPAAPGRRLSCRRPLPRPPATASHADGPRSRSTLPWCSRFRPVSARRRSGDRRP